MQLTSQLQLDLFVAGPQKDPLIDMSPEALLPFLSENLSGLAFSRLFGAFKTHHLILGQTILRMAIHCKERGISFNVSLEAAKRRCFAIENNRRRKFVRRMVKAAPLFALQLIRERYPNYKESEMATDLKLAKNYKKHEKFVKRPSQMGLRISQICKLGNELRFTDPSSAEYNRYCNLIAGYHNGLKNKLPIQLTVSYAGIFHVYTFPWNDTELRIKAFVALTKRVNSFDELDKQLAENSRYGS